MERAAPSLPDYTRRIADWLATPWSCAALLLAAVWLPDRGNAPAILLFAVSALADTAPFIIAAILLIAGLKASGAESMVAAAFKGREGRMITAALGWPFAIGMAVWALVKPRVFAAYLGLGLVFAVLAGLGFGAVI